MRDWARGELESIQGQLPWKTAAGVLEQPREVRSPGKQPELRALDPYNSVSQADILNRDDPEVQERLSHTYWVKLSKAEQDKRYNEIVQGMKQDAKEEADHRRRVQSGIGNPFMANLVTGGSNMLVNSIETAAVGLPSTIAKKIMGPMPEGYVDPLDDRYGKRAGELAGEGIGFLLPFRYVKIGSPTWLGKLSPTAVRTTTSGAIYSSTAELSDAATDFRQDGSQSMGKRLGNVAMDSALAGAGDVAGHAGGRIVSGVLKKINVKPAVESNFNTPGTKPIVAASPQEQVGFAKVEGLRGIEGTGYTIINIKEISLLLKTEPDTAFFWSGRTNGKGGADVAEEIARSNSGVTLESTIKDNSITMPEWDFNNPGSIQAWEDVSAEYARQVKGEVRAVVGKELRIGNIWENIELPRLIKNPEITKITIIDPEDGIKKIIFERDR
ncbi:hypothetical protein CGZ75_02115 [Paenibacillus herberti]|uniref:Pre-toxin TG domain-containing protein n=1 Tax=Paenibacillus herberti TaxID=1619309 RepID=A0A229NZX2_9BACL|nr:hypothetical protein CGZ75_02115 [Paenibacillus herberti]